MVGSLSTDDNQHLITKYQVGNLVVYSRNKNLEEKNKGYKLIAKVIEE
jgi:hypothetical protein